MFINLSNHPHYGWQPAQLEAAEHYGEVVDSPFRRSAADDRRGTRRGGGMLFCTRDGHDPRFGAWSGRNRTAPGGRIYDRAEGMNHLGVAVILTGGRACPRILFITLA